MKILFDTETQAVMAVDKEILLTPTFDSLIGQYLRHKKEMELFEEELKQKIAGAINELDPTFSSLIGDNCKIFLSPRGAKYMISEETNPLYVKQERKPDTEAIDEFLGKTGTLPSNVAYATRSRSLTLTLKK